MKITKNKTIIKCIAIGLLSISVFQNINTPINIASAIVSNHNQTDKVNMICEYSGELTVYSNDKTIIATETIIANQTFTLNLSIGRYKGIVKANDGSIYLGNIEVDVNFESKIELQKIEMPERSTRAMIQFESENNNTIKKANLIINDMIFGRIQKKGDVDFFKIVIQENGDYAILLDDMPVNQDYDLALYNSNQKEIAVSSGVSDTEFLKINNAKAGDIYYAKVFGYKTSFDKEATYRLQVAKFPVAADDYGNSFDNAFLVSDDSITKGAIDYINDIDFFVFKAQKSGIYKLFTEGDTDTVGFLYDSNQKLLTQNDNAKNWNFEIQHNLVQGETYYIAIKHAYAKTGEYTFYIKSPEDEFKKPNAGNNFETATSIEVDQSIDAYFENLNDARYFKFTPTKSGSYGFYTSGLNMDTYGILYDDNQKIIAENDNSGVDNHFLIAKTLLAGKNYYIKVNNQNHNLNDIEFALYAVNYEKNNNYSQYHILNTESGMDINVVPAWQMTTGKDIKVAIADSGIDYNHENLLNNLNLNLSYNFTHNEKNIFPVGENIYSGSAAINGHGTHVAGIVAATTNLEFQTTGIAPNATIIGYKILGTHINGNENYTGSITAFVNAIDEAKKEGVKIMNCSFGGSAPSALEQEAMENAQDILFVISSGNAGANLENKPEYPACYYLKNGIVVAAVDEMGQLADYSNYGGSTDIAAPGSNIYSTVPNNGFGNKTGTSMATPIVTGVSALVMEKYPNLNPVEIKNIITGSNNVTYTNNLNNKVKSAGIVNAFKAVTNDTNEHMSREVTIIDRNPFANRDVKSVITETMSKTSDAEKTGNLIVKLKNNIDIKEFIDKIQTNNITFELLSETAISNAYELHTSSVQDADQLVSILNTYDEVVYSEPNYIRY